MTPFGYFIVALSLVHAALEAACRYREGPLQLVGVIFSLIWISILLVLIVRVHRLGSRARLLAAALLVWVVAAPFAGGHCGTVIRDSVFRSRLPEYEAVVRAMETGDIPPVAPRLAHHVTRLEGDRVVLFVWGAGFPVKHTVFVHSPTDPSTNPAFVRSWPYVRTLAPNWYVAKD